MSAAEINGRNAHILLFCRIRRNCAADFPVDPADAVDQGGGMAVTG